MLLTNPCSCQLGDGMPALPFQCADGRRVNSPSECNAAPVTCGNGVTYPNFTSAAQCPPAPNGFYYARRGDGYYLVPNGWAMPPAPNGAEQQSLAPLAGSGAGTPLVVWRNSSGAGTPPAVVSNDTPPAMESSTYSLASTTVAPAPDNTAALTAPTDAAQSPASTPAKPAFPWGLLLTVAGLLLEAH